MLNNMPQQDDRLSIFKLIDIFLCILYWQNYNNSFAYIISIHNIIVYDFHTKTQIIIHNYF